MKKITIIILAIFSCTAFKCTAPVIEPQERCTITFSFNYGTDEQISNFFKTIEKYKSEENQEIFIDEVLAIFGKTKCHDYDLMNIKRISEIRNYPAWYANNSTGFGPDQWGNITPWARESKRYFEDVCTKWWKQKNRP